MVVVNHKGAHHNADNADTYLIPYSAIRLIHKVMSNTFFGQGQINKVPLKDVAYLWALSSEWYMVHDWVGLFIRRCDNVRDTASKKISLGGMISILVRSKVDITHLSETWGVWRTSGSRRPSVRH